MICSSGIDGTPGVHVIPDEVTLLIDQARCCSINSTARWFMFHTKQARDIQNNCCQLSTMSGLKKEGPFGNPQGTEFDFDKNHPPKSLASFQVWTRNDEISAISFTYKDESGAETTRGPFGQTAGAKKFDEVKLQVGEVVTKLTGTFTAERITSLTVTTNIAAAGYGPFGQPSGSGFQTIHPKIVAFFGWCTQDISVNAIGTYYLPN